MIKPFTITRIPRIAFGEGRLAEVPGLAASFGSRALVVTGARSFQSSVHWMELAEGMRGAGLSWSLVTVQGEPSPTLVDEVVRTHREQGVDVVIAVGGGSAIDAGKAIAGLLPSGNSVMDHLEGVGRGIPYSGPPTPFIAVPTTAGTGAEATKNAVLSAPGPEGFKKSFRHDLLTPDIAIVDPLLTYTCPRNVTASVGMDALTQLIESYTSTNANPFTDALAFSGIEAAKDGLLAAYDGETSGRNRMSYAALVSGITLTQAGLGAVHGLASPLGGVYPVPHSVACGAMLAPATRTNIAALRERDPESPALEKYARLGRLLGDSPTAGRDEACDLLVRTLAEWRTHLGIPGLGAFGIDESGFSKVVAGYGAKTSPAALTSDEITGILRESV